MHHSAQQSDAKKIGRSKIWTLTKFLTNTSQVRNLGPSNPVDVADSLLGTMLLQCVCFDRGALPFAKEAALPALWFTMHGLLKWASHHCLRGRKATTAAIAGITNKLLHSQPGPKKLILDDTEILSHPGLRARDRQT